MVKVIDINTGKESKKVPSKKVRALLWSRLLVFLRSGLLSIHVADTKLNQSELDAMIEIWLEELVEEEKNRKRKATKERVRKRRSNEKGLDT